MQNRLLFSSSEGAGTCRAKARAPRVPTLSSHRETTSIGRLEADHTSDTESPIILFIEYDVAYRVDCNLRGARWPIALGADR